MRNKYDRDDFPPIFLLATYACVQPICNRAGNLNNFAILGDILCHQFSVKQSTNR